MTSLDSNQIKELEDKITEIVDVASCAKFHLLCRDDLNSVLVTLDDIEDIINDIHTLVTFDR